MSEVFREIPDGFRKLSDGLNNVSYSLGKVSDGPLGKVSGGVSKEADVFGKEYWNLSSNLIIKTCFQARFGHVTFVTPNQTIATCGGWIGSRGKKTSTCLVLNPGEEGEWQPGVMGDLVMGQQFAATCPTLDGGICNFPFIFSKH